MNIYIFTDILLNISYFEINVSRVLGNDINKRLCEKLIYTEKSDECIKWKVEGSLHRLHRLHRLDGPAVERVDGYKVWYLYGFKLKEE